MYVEIRFYITDFYLEAFALDQVILGTMTGAAIGKSTARRVVKSLAQQVHLTLGYFFSYILKLSGKRGFADRESYVAQYLALSIFTMGLTQVLGNDDLLAAFTAGEVSVGTTFVMCMYPPYFSW
jgi:hypothetical protein